MNAKQAALKIIADDSIRKLSNCEEGKECFDTPYRHIICDDFLPLALARQGSTAFPDLQDKIWEHENSSDIEVKSRTVWKSEFDVPDSIIDVVRIMNSSIFLSALSRLLRIPKLLPDPYFSGGGLNVSSQGGLLDVHVDGNYHDASGLNRRANAILYLTENWQPEWGGALELYDSSGKVRQKSVESKFNRLFIFDSHDFSFHGLPKPILCPKDQTRKSLILYYYTVAKRPDEQVRVSDPHSALWVKRDLKDKRGNLTREHF